VARCLRPAAVAAAVVLTAACHTEPPLRPAPAAEPQAGVRVEGNRIVDGQDREIRMRGFNVSGAEYSCIEGNGFFDTPSGAPPDEAALKAMRSWRGADAVRVPLNEQCWLGLPAAPRKYAGQAYRDAVAGFVRRLNAQGFVVILDLHRSAPGDGVSREQEPMPDRDHSIDFWTSMATTFTSGAVVFDLFNEPFPYEETDTDRAWACWRAGGCTLTSANTGRPYVAAGMDELISAVRATGSRTVVLAGGVYWAESMTGWLKNRPTDPAGQLAASFHAYSFNEYCAAVACYDRDLAPIAAEVPLIAGEVGPTLVVDPAKVDEHCSASAARAGGWADETLDWLDAHHAGYTAWTWNPWGDCWSLVQNWSGEPTPMWGEELRRRLAAA
jgi:endoglucanase